MANNNFVVKNGLTVNGSFTANSTVVNASAVSVTSLVSGANVTVNTTTHYVGNATVNTNITAGQISISGVTVNSTIYQGTSNNSTNLNGQAASYYTNIPARLGYTPANKAGEAFSGQVGATSFVTNTNQPYYMRSDGAVYMSWDGTNISFNQSVSTSGGMTSAGGYYTGTNCRADALFIGGGSGYAPKLKCSSTSNYVYFKWDGSSLNYNVDDAFNRNLIYGGIKRIDASYPEGAPGRIDFLQSDDNIAFTFIDGYSDIRLKTNILASQVDSLSLINQVQLKQFNWNEEGMSLQRKTEKDRTVKIGMIAQEIEQLFPESISNTTNTAGEGKESTSRKVIKLDALIPYLIGAIQQQQKQIDELKKLLSSINIK